MRTKRKTVLVATAAVILVVAAILLAGRVLTDCFPRRALELSSLDDATYFPPGIFFKNLERDKSRRGV